MSHSLGFRSAVDNHNRLLMTSQWPDNCDAITWVVISYSWYRFYSRRYSRPVVSERNIVTSCYNTAHFLHYFVIHNVYHSKLDHENEILDVFWSTKSSKCSVLASQSLLWCHFGSCHSEIRQQQCHPSQSITVSNIRINICRSDVQVTFQMFTCPFPNKTTYTKLCLTQ